MVAGSNSRDPAKITDGELEPCDKSCRVKKVKSQLSV